METTTPTKPQTGQGPAAKVRLGRIQASIWENASEKGPYYTVTLDRRYTDAEGNWQSTQSFKLDDLLLLAKAADKAHDEIIRLRREKVTS